MLRKMRQCWWTYRHVVHCGMIVILAGAQIGFAVGSHVLQDEAGEARRLFGFLCSANLARVQLRRGGGGGRKASIDGDQTSAQRQRKLEMSAG